MPLGDVLSYNSESLISKTYYRAFGIPALHSHIRWQAVKKYIDKSGEKNADIGCGWGLMSFGFVKETGKPIDCVDIDPKLIEFGKKLAKKAGIDKIRFIIDALPKLPKLTRNYYDQVLLIDVLEHVNEDLESLITINSLLRMGGILIISVPTPNYPKYFGYDFAKKIGHVRDGYTIEDLRRLLKHSGFEIIEWSYHTNLLSPYLCKFWYQYNLPFKAKALLFPILKTLTRFDSIGKGINSCGIVVKAVKVRRL